MQRSIATALGEALAATHDGPVFGVSGSGNFVAMETFHRLTGRYVAANHESAAVTMADGWSQVAGAVGVASVHQGPGFTNALTALVDSAKQRVPLVVMVAEMNERDADHHQYLDQRAVVNALGLRIGTFRVRADEDPLATVQAAFAAARSGPATVVLGMPIDILALPESSSIVSTRDHVPPRLPIDVGQVEHVVKLLTRARQPVLVVGRGGRHAAEQIASIAQNFDAAIATTLAADGVFADSPRSVGFIGGFAQQRTVDAITAADLVVGFGTSFDEWSTAGGALLPAEDVVSIAYDPPLTGASEWINAEAAAFADAVLDSSRPPASAPDAGARESTVGQGSPKPGSDGPLLHPARVFADLDDLLPTPRTIALDSGHFMAWAGMYLRARSDGLYLVGQGFQSVGLGLARGIGASLAAPDRTTIAVLGDGGFFMGLSDLETAVRVQAPLLVVVVNDAGYGAEVHDFAPEGFATDIVQFPERDIARAAAGLGARSLVVRTLDDLRTAVRDVTPGGPVVLDCRVDPDADAADFMTAVGRAHWTGHPGAVPSIESLV